MKINEKDFLILSHLRRNARMKLTDLSKATKVAVSTLFDRIKLYEGHDLIKKNTALVSFEKLGYNAKALISFSTGKKDRKKLFELLSRNGNVNSLYKVNNSWDFLVEVIFPGVKEVEDFIESIEELVKVRNKKFFAS